jgi:peptidoglycan/LPS O-acetylase OafA/YrhL
MPEVAARAEALARDGSESDAGRLSTLDGLRGLAILLVMQYHFWGLSFGLTGWNPSNPLDRFVARLFGVGWSGVDLFFVLSGFLITGILLDAKGSAFYFRNFYARRFLRIFPLYYGFLAFALLVLPNFDRLANPAGVLALHHTQFWFWSYTSNIGAAIKAAHTNIPLQYSQFWSLAVEEQFYLLWPLLLLLLNRRAMTILCAVLVVSALVLRIVLVQPMSAPLVTIAAPHNMLPARMDTLALGALLALGLRNGGLARFRPHAKVICAASLVVLIALFIKEGGLSALNSHIQTFGFTALALLFASTVLLVLTSRPASMPYRMFAHPVLRGLGRYSYAIYVFHLLIAFDMTAEFARGDLLRTVYGSQIPADIVFSTCCTTISVGAAWLSWHLFESQILKLKRFVPYVSPRTIEGQGPAAMAVGPAMPATSIAVDTGGASGLAGTAWRHQ